MQKLKLLALAALTLTACAPQVTTAANPYLQPARPLVIAHQGAKALRPSNTMVAFQHAATLAAAVL